MTPDEEQVYKNIGKELLSQFEKLPIEHAIEFFAGWYITFLKNHGASKKDVQDWMRKAIHKVYSTE